MSHLSQQKLELAVLPSLVIFLFLPSSPLMLWWDEVIMAFQREKHKKALFQTERINLVIQAAQTVLRFVFPSQMFLAIEVISDSAIFFWGGIK